MLVAEKRITVAEFRQMEFDGPDAWYELINGQVVKKAASGLLHQEVSQNLTLLIGQFVRAQKLGKVFTAPTDVFWNEYNHVLPDIFFVHQDRLDILDYQEGVVTGVPDLIVEIISPGSIREDRIAKKAAYESAGVREYWLIDPKNRSVEVYTLEDGHFDLFAFAAETGAVSSKVLEGFEAEISAFMP